MPNDLIIKLRDIFQADIENLGYELVDIEFVNEDGENFLRFFIYNEDGITLDDCEKVSRFVDPKLDEVNLIDKQYFLEVSSPDLNRPIVTNDDLRRNLGVELTVNLYKKIDNKKNYEGYLVSYNEDEIILESNYKEIKLNRKDISLIKVLLHF